MQRILKIGIVTILKTVSCYRSSFGKMYATELTDQFLLVGK